MTAHYGVPLVTGTRTSVMMPELGRVTEHKEAVALIRDWITAWPGACR